jgi:hypothetical protein
MSAIDTARFSLPSKLVTMYDKKIGTAVQIPAPPKQMNAYLNNDHQYQRRQADSEDLPNGSLLDSSTDDEGDSSPDGGGDDVVCLLVRPIRIPTHCERDDHGDDVDRDRHDCLKNELEMLRGSRGDNHIGHPGSGTR